MKQIHVDVAVIGGGTAGLALIVQRKLTLRMW